MNSVFKLELDESEIKRINEFCNSVDYCSIEQSLGWTKLFFNSKICFFYLHDESGIQSFCQIHERHGSAQIVFGPVCSDKELMVISIDEIIKYYKKRNFYYLGIEMYCKSGFDTEYIEYALNKSYRIKYLFNSENTRSSIELNLEESIEEINRRIKKGHKSDIKRAIKMGVTIDVVNDTKELLPFVEVYSRMCQMRKINNSEITTRNIYDLYNYLIENKKGQILIAKDNLGKVLGGAIFVYQGISVRYYKSASDPDRREIPLNHLLIYEAIKKAKNENYKYFDFWGYNHFVNENDQVFQINRFKKGFGGYYTFFAKKMNIELIKNGYIIFRVLLFVKKLLKK